MNFEKISAKVLNKPNELSVACNICVQIRSYGIPYTCYTMIHSKIRTKDSMREIPEHEFLEKQ